jgi:hypothetical protein
MATRTKKATTRKARNGNRTPEKDLLGLVHGVVDKGATAVEEIHRSIAGMPLQAMEQAGVFEKTAEDVRHVQSDAIGAVYSLIRDINKRVEKFSTELLHDLSEQAGQRRNEADR